MKILKTSKGNITIIDDASLLIDSADSFLDVLVLVHSDTFVLEMNNFDASFYDLRSCLAGEILQKVSNYQKRLIILGNFNSYHSKNFKDFIFESNKNGKIIFCDDLKNAITLLK